MTSPKPPSPSAGLESDARTIRSTRRSSDASTTAANSTSVASPAASSSGNASTPTAAVPSIVSTGDYTRHNAPQRSKFKPRWHTQPYVMFLALRAMPGRTAARQELINATLELDRKISQEKGLPRVFTGKTPMNSASACLTNNGDKYFIPFKPEGSRSTHFRLAYQPGDFETAVKEYDSWMEKLIKHDWPLCFGVPKEGAIPIHILEQQEQEQKALEQQVAESENLHATMELTTTTTVASTSTSDHADSTIEPTEVKAEAAMTENGTVLSAESKKRVPESVETELDDTSRNIKKPRSDQAADLAGILKTDTPDRYDQDSNMTDKLQQLELKSGSSATPSEPSTPGTTHELESTTSTSTTSALTDLNTATPFSKAGKSGAVEKVDEYRLEDLDLSNVPTSLADVVRVDVSTIPNSGNGLFAKVDLPASTPLGFYFGVPMTENEFDSLKDGVGVASHYSIMYRRTVLDATDENGMPYNDPNGRLYCPFHFMNEDPSGNISFITGSVVNQVICTTNRDVKAGEELFVFYGKEVDRHWEGQDGSGSENSSSVGGDQKKERAGSRSRASSPVRREETVDRPRRNNVFKPARYTR